MESGSNSEKSPYYKWLVTVAVMSGATLVVLDITIVNVALPQIMAGFGVTVDKIQWVLTAYMLTMAIMMAFSCSANKICWSILSIIRDYQKIVEKFLEKT